MRARLTVKGRSLLGSSDLTIVAPLRQGLVSSLDSVTYGTRALELFRVLGGARASLHEYELFRPISDAIERVGVIQSVRVALLDPGDRVMLAVTFDGTWEAYIRTLWQRVGTLLDVIFCNTEGYPVAALCTCEAWGDWVRRSQIETQFFFATHGHTALDAPYQQAQSLIFRRGGGDAALQATRLAIAPAEETALAAARADFDSGLATIRQSLQGLAVLYRLAQYYQPGTDDGAVLQRAARDLLREFVVMAGEPTFPAALKQGMARRFRRQLDWLLPGWLDAGDNRVPVPPRVAVPPPRPATDFERKDVQGGILSGYEDSVGCLVLVAFDDRAGAAALLERLIPQVTTEAQAAASAAGCPHGAGLRLNLALTGEGLRVLGLDESQLAWFPQEFREGMEARASILGDVRANHPRRWRLPVPNWGVTAAQPPLELSTVHLVVQLRAPGPAPDHDEVARQDHPLHAAVARLFGAPDKPLAGARVLAVEGMRRLQAGGQTSEHFGFADVVSNPQFAPVVPPPQVYANQVHLGEVLIGHPNAADPAPLAVDADARARLELLRNGTFLVLRKLRQDVGELRSAVEQGAHAAGIEPAQAWARLVGRERDGAPLVPGGPGHNDFDYRADPQGRLCPLHAHVRRANPRLVPGPADQPGRRPPRIVRRGMSYGLPYDKEPEAERGLYFMAYNASIAEQFETIQRWLAGGNSTGGESGQSDPLLGVPEVGRQRLFSFEAQVPGGPQAVCLGLDRAPGLNQEARPFVRLEWGAYLFVPSLTGLRVLHDQARAGAGPGAVWSVQQGEALLAALPVAAAGEPAAVAAWKALIEDPEARDRFDAASLWAAVRNRHGGALRTPYGLLVGGEALVREVLGDRAGRFSVCGYDERLRQSLGRIYLGLDAGPEYTAQSTNINHAIGAISDRDAFVRAHRYAAQALQGLMAQTVAEFGLVTWPAHDATRRWELILESTEVNQAVLARLCQDWFGLPADSAHPFIRPGAWDWDWKPGDPVLYPAQFLAPSRYVFQPRPGAQACAFGQQVGSALTQALGEFLAGLGGSCPSAPDGSDAPLAKAIVDASAGDPDLLARNFAGILMGFLPTVDGNLRSALNTWLTDNTFWNLRAAWAALGPLAAGDDAACYGRAMDLLWEPLLEALQLRPVPELVWRTARRDGDYIGGVQLRQGDVVVAALVSGAHEALEQGRTDVSLVFGGDRSLPGHPVHACPGMWAGLGVLLGVFTALVELDALQLPAPAGTQAPPPLPVDLRAVPVPLAFRISGAMP